MDLERLMRMDFRTWCIISGLFFLILYIVLMLTDPPQHDVLLFYEYSQMFKEGTLFNHGVVSGYPPLSWVFIIFPGLFSDDLNVYYAIFAAVDIVCMFIIGLLLYRICEKRTSYLIPLLLVYLVMMLLYSDHAVRKFDIIPALMMTLAIYQFLKNRYASAVIICALGALVKYFPALLIPVFLVMVLYDKDALKNTLKGLVLCIALGLVALAALLGTGLMDYNSILGFITSQDTRGFHIESLVGTFSTVICDLTGMPTWYVSSTDFTLDVQNSICDALIGPWMYVLLASILLVLFLTFYSFYKRHDIIMNSEEESFQFLIAASLAVVFMFVLVNKVFSTQFMLWLVPLMLMFVCYRRKNETAVFLVMCVLTMLISCIFLRFSSQEIMMFRDLILILIMVLSFSYLITGEWSVNIDREAET